MSPAWKPPRADRVRRIRDRLREAYGIPGQRPHGRPVGELVLNEVRAAPVDEIEEAIRPGGLAPTKSRRIKEILEAIGDPLSLDWLADAPVPEGQAYLCDLPGVGRKTAACVLLFSFGLRDVPVDTHVGRVATRLGLLREKAGSTEQADAMTALTPPGEELEFHLNLLRHGRHTCHSQRPDCRHCVLRRMCPYARANNL